MPPRIAPEDPPVAMAPSILELDPPEHPRYRKIVSRAFTPTAVTRPEPRIRELTRLVFDADVDGELIVFCMSLLVAGNETTRNLVSGGTAALAEHPDQRAWFADAPAERGAHAVEEMLRWVTPVKAFARTATADTELAGRVIAAGDYVVMLYASGNRDASAFGFGEHLCLRAGPARLEARIVFEELLTRFPGHVLTGAFVRLQSALINGFERLPAVLTAGTAKAERR